MEFDIVRYYLRIIGQNIVRYIVRYIARYIVRIYRTIYRSDISCDIFRHPRPSPFFLPSSFFSLPSSRSSDYRGMLIFYRDLAVSITAAMLIRCLPLSFSTCALTVRYRSNQTSSARSALETTRPQQEHQLEAALQHQLEATLQHQLEAALQ